MAGWDEGVWLGVLEAGTDLNDQHYWVANGQLILDCVLNAVVSDDHRNEVRARPWGNAGCCRGWLRIETQGVVIEPEVRLAVAGVRQRLASRPERGALLVSEMPLPQTPPDRFDRGIEPRPLRLVRRGDSARNARRAVVPDS